VRTAGPEALVNERAVFVSPGGAGDGPEMARGRCGWLRNRALNGFLAAFDRLWRMDAAPASPPAAPRLEVDGHATCDLVANLVA
jgi:hypothetical protein